jgi:plasmid stability protein
MTALLVKNMPPKLHEQLRRRAKEHHRSMNREVVAILERELGRPSPQEPPPLVKTARPLDHDWIVQTIRDARDGKR